ILNGIDTTLWNPAQDTALAATYDATNLIPKCENTRALRQALKLDEEPGHMLIGMVGRLTEQKGVDLVLAAVADILALPAQLALLGTGDKRLQEAWRELASRHPGRVAAIIGFDETLAHRIEAGADLFLMPSRFEPCGLNQMYSMRYGTPPVVHAVGGLADTVVDASPENLATGSATGFCFHAPEVPAMLGALRRACALWADRNAWQGLMVNGMCRDFGWTPVAEAYLALYRRLAAAA
ncbi:MAG: glycosyltransferase, partial [Burkholderiales bacterium]